MSNSTEFSPNPHDRPFQVLANTALEAFWQLVVEHHPEAKKGDLSPWATITLQLAAEDAIAEWVANNVPPSVTKGA